jgi:uncharacterized protein YjbI with pentapeptide repeats
VTKEERGVATDPPQLPETAEESDEQSSRVELWRVVLAVLVLGGVVEVLIYGYLERPGWIGSSGKQFWDYLDLLIVPAALALGVYWLNRRQTERDQQAQDAQQERALAVESQRAQDEALQAYLDQMSQLLADPERPLRRARPGDTLSMLARARTLTVLQRLESRLLKRSVVQFLYEAGLITKDHVVVELTGADLAKANLNEANVEEANLCGAYLARANLVKAKLRRADLSNAKLFGADLSLAKLDGANLSDAVLIGDKRSTPVQRISAPEKYTLGGVGPKNADLSYTDLSGANLWNAYVSEKQLDSADSLIGATVPNGRKYENWLKIKRHRDMEHGKNGGTP